MWGKRDKGKLLIIIFFQNDKCRYNPGASGATDVGFTDIEEGNEQQLKEAVATIGPISVAIDASHESFQFYKKGAYVTAVPSKARTLFIPFKLLVVENVFQYSLQNLQIFIIMLWMLQILCC